MMDIHDPRHGSPAGYQAHLRNGETACDHCAVGRFRAQKRTSIERQQGVQFFYTADDVLAVVEPWIVMGLSLGAVTVAAGIGGQYSGQIYAMMRGERMGVRRSTFAALSRVTEDDFSERAKVYGDLTRMRVGSLMAAGHELKSMPIAFTGQWRTRSHVEVGVARAIRSHYRANEFTIGTNAHTRSRARNAGHRPPLAWDDPDTLAWPDDERPNEAWEYVPASRADHLADLDHRQAGITEVCAELGIRRDSVERWCERHGLRAMYVRFMERETPIVEHRNQWSA